MESSYISGGAFGKREIEGSSNTALFFLKRTGGAEAPTEIY